MSAERKPSQVVEGVDSSVVTTIEQRRSINVATEAAAQSNDAASIMSVIIQVAANPNVDVGNMERLMQSDEEAEHIDLTSLLGDSH